MKPSDAAAEDAASRGAMLPPTPSEAAQRAITAALGPIAGKGRAKPPAPGSVPWDDSKRVIRSPPGPSSSSSDADAVAKHRHIEARSELLSLIAEHAAEELGEELGAALEGGGGRGDAAELVVTVPPPRLALAEAAARRKAERDAEEERAKRQAAVEEMMRDVARRNEKRREKAEAKAAAPREDEETKNPERGGAEAGPSKGKDSPETAAERARRKAEEREANKPWRANMRAPDAPGARAKRPASDVTDPPTPSGDRNPASFAAAASSTDAEDAARRRAEAEARREEVRAYMQESKAKWREKLRREREDLQAKERRRLRILKEEREAAREKARALALRRDGGAGAAARGPGVEWDGSLAGDPLGDPPGSEAGEGEDAADEGGSPGVPLVPRVEPESNVEASESNDSNVLVASDAASRAAARGRAAAKARLAEIEAREKALDRGSGSALGGSAFASNRRGEALAEERRRAGEEAAARRKAEERAARDAAVAARRLAAQVAREAAEMAETDETPSAAAKEKNKSDENAEGGSEDAPRAGALSAAPSPARSALKKRPEQPSSAHAGAAEEKAEEGKRVAFSETVRRSDGAEARMTREPEAAGAENRSPDDDVTLASDERAESDGSSSADASEYRRLGPRLAERMRGRPATTTALPNDAHVPRAEDWLALGARARGVARLARLRPPRDPNAPERDPTRTPREGADGGDERGDESGRIGATSAGVGRSEPASRRVPRGIGSESRPRASGSSGLPPRRGAREPVGVLRVYASRAKAEAAAARAAAASAETVAEAEARGAFRAATTVDSAAQTEDQRTQTRGPAEPAPFPPTTAMGSGSPTPATNPRLTTPRGLVVPAGAPRGSAASPASEASSSSSEDPPSPTVDPATAARAAALVAADASRRSARVSPAELERRLLSELDLAEEMHEIAAELERVGMERDAFAAEQAAGKLAAIVEVQTAARRESEVTAARVMAERTTRTNDARGEDEGEDAKSAAARVPDLERLAAEISAKIREESLARVKEIADAFLADVAKGAVAGGAASLAAGAALAARLGVGVSADRALEAASKEDAGESEETPSARAAAAAAAFGSPATVEEAASEKEGSVAAESSVADEVGHVSFDRGEASMASADESIPEESMARGEGLADSDLDRSSGPAERSRDDASRGGEGARGDVGGNESFDGDSFDERYRAVSAKHDEVHAQLKARQRELRAAELAAKRSRIAEMERELARLDAGGAPRGFDDAFDDDRASKSSAEIPEDIIEAGSATSPGSSLAREAADVDHPGPLAAHEARVAALEALVERRRREALETRRLRSREKELREEARALDAAIDDIRGENEPAAARVPPEKEAGEEVSKPEAKPGAGGEELTSRASPPASRDPNARSPSPSPIPREFAAGVRIGPAPAALASPASSDVASEVATESIPGGGSAAGDEESGGSDRSDATLRVSPAKEKSASPAKAHSPPKSPPRASPAKSPGLGKKSKLAATAAALLEDVEPAAEKEPTTTQRAAPSSGDPAERTLLAALSGALVDEAAAEVARVAASKSARASERQSGAEGTSPSPPPSLSIDPPGGRPGTDPAATPAPPPQVPPPVPPPSALAMAEARDAARDATRVRAEAFARAALQLSGAGDRGLDEATLAALDARPDAALRAAANRAGGGGGEADPDPLDCLTFDTTAEAARAASGGALALAFRSAKTPEEKAVAGETLAAYVAARVAAEIAGVSEGGDGRALKRGGGGGDAVDDVVRNDARTSDDLGWYGVEEAERAVVARLAEDIFDELVEDTVLSGLS
jgi:hypothetical protein